VPDSDVTLVSSAGDFKLDDLGAPDDNTDLNFTTSAHGLVPKGTDTGNFLKDDGTWASAGGGDLSFGGDTFGADKTIGSNDTYSLSFETDGTERLKLHSDGRGVSEFTAAAWITFDGDDNIIADNHNISSLTDNATGNYTLNFTNSLSNANYADSVMASGRTAVFHARGYGDKTTALRDIYTINTDHAIADGDIITYIVFCGS